jgi:hypothetical protein
VTGGSQGKVRQGKIRQGKARQGRARQGKAKFNVSVNNRKNLITEDKSS